MAWTLAVTQPNREQTARVSLRRVGLPFHLFRYRIRQVSQGRVIQLLKPAWPRYVFIDTDWRDLRELPGMFGYVQFGGYPVDLTKGFIDNLVSKCLKDEIPDLLPLPEEAPKFSFGDRVRIKDPGRLYDAEAVYQYPSYAHYALVLLPWLGRMVPTEVDEELLEKIELPKPVEQKAKPGRPRRRNRNRRRDGSLGQRASVQASAVA